ncbi:uncharacterized protein DNG_09896 [Cephalotrichum gorgonifer]|uniref:Thioesterase domain-containing protein n=1 Tax=Cephalotrichum gorgonifer TaxID=2041049 RepID=A0AAE8T0F5_9PEZI|nr:uncharacterized protein DNG_09896 [Cephalotrichum gorgonifer]
MSPSSPDTADAAYFKFVPWCNDLISRQGSILFTPTSRLPDDPTIGATRDQLFRKTLHHDGALPYCIGLYQDPTTSPDLQPTTPGSGPQSPTLYIKSSSILFDLRPGLNGFNGSAHGGLLSSLIDEAMGSLIFINHLVQTTHEKQGRKLPAGTLDLNSTRVFTASMAVRFQKPVPTPSIVVVTASLVKIEGRKIFFDVTVKGQHGEEYARCDGLWLSLPLEKV